MHSTVSFKLSNDQCPRIAIEAQLQTFLLSSCGLCIFSVGEWVRKSEFIRRI